MAMQPTYDGGAFLPEGSKRSNGAITISRAGVSIHFEESSLTLPLDGLKIRSGGANDRLLFFAHPAHAGASIFTSDRSVLSDPFFRERPEISDSIRTIHRGVNRRRAMLLVVLAIVAGLIYALFASKDFLVAIVADRVPPSVEQKLGEVAMRQILLSSRTVSDPRVVAPMTAILERLETGIEDPRYELTLYVVDDPTINAFALPGGYVVLHTGLIEKAASSDEIGGVLAHEIAHVVERHSLRQLISSLGVFVLVQAVFGDVSGIIAAAAEGGADLLVLRFSRDAEREADERGLEILVSAGVDPSGMVSFFETLCEQEETGSIMPAMLSTHPATDERIGRLREMVSEVDRSMLGSIDVDLDGAKGAVEE